MIRPATRADLHVLLDLWEELMRNGASFDPRFSLTSDGRDHMRGWMIDSWFRTHPFPHAFVWDDHGPKAMIHGFPKAALPVLEGDPTVRIGDLFVSDSHRRQGIGRSLVDHLLQSARDAGYPRAEVGTLTADNRAVEFWQRMGFGAWQVHLSREA